MDFYHGQFVMLMLCTALCQVPPVSGKVFCNTLAGNMLAADRLRLCLTDMQSPPMDIQGERQTVTHFAGLTTRRPGFASCWDLCVLHFIFSPLLFTFSSLSCWLLVLATKSYLLVCSPKPNKVVFSVSCHNPTAGFPFVLLFSDGGSTLCQCSMKGLRAQFLYLSWTLVTFWFEFLH